MARNLVVLATLLTACGSSTPNVAAPVAASAAAPTTASHWHEDAAEAAFADGQRSGKLVLADLWAPWCHTCLSMRAQVLRPDAVPELASVVLLSIDTERAENEAFLQRYPVGVWPTFYLVDAKTREVRGRWLGAATPAELSHWLNAGAGESSGYEQQLRDADAFAAKRELAEAEKSYRAALAAAPADWVRRPATLVSLVSVLSKQKKDASCLELALQALPSLPASVSAVDFAATALGCADRAPNDENGAKLRAIAERTLSRDCEKAAPGAAVDDQADACGNLRRVREALKDDSGARSAAERALAVIATGSTGAPPNAQAIYDWERTSSLLFLGRSAEAEALLLEREKQLPESYNPPHYLARLYRDTQRWEDGLAAIERALTKAYGPRRVGFLGVKADLLKGAGKLEEGRQVLEQQLRDYRALPPGQRNPDAEAAVEKRLAAW
jgi:thiol-disulfide isomerase/thioredoxin